MAQSIEGLDRLTVEPEELAGPVCIRGYRFTVEHPLELLAAGMTFEQIQEDFPFIEPADIHQTLRYAARLAAQDGCLPFAESA